VLKQAHIFACHLQIDADPDPDSAYHFDADPDLAYHLATDPDPTYQFHPDPQDWLTRCRKRFQYLSSRLFLNPEIVTVLSSKKKMVWLRVSKKNPDRDPWVKKAPDPEHCKPSSSSLIMLFYLTILFLVS
jgi:hypothetical protein